MDVKRNILLNPGPATTTDRVKQSLIVPDICPREKEFGELVGKVRRKLLQVINGLETHTSVLLTGSGTAGIEAALSSIVGPGDKVFIIGNGAYGQRAEQIARAYGISSFYLQLPWTSYPDIAQIERWIRNDPQITHLYFVHHETTTGMLNPLEDLIDLCRRYRLISIVDAVSSYAGIPIDLSRTPIDFLVSSANKCLQGFAGISFVICRIECIKQIEKIPVRNLYLNLYHNYLSQEQTNEFQFTPAVQIVYALNQALDEFFEETQAGRYERYCRSYRALMEGIEDLGLTCLLPKNLHSKLLTSINEPAHPQFSFDGAHDYLLNRDITIYPGKGIENTFRIANIGAIDSKDIDYFLLHLKNYLAALKII